MNTYIGCKLIKAEPAYRDNGVIYPKSGPVPRSMTREDGYKVMYGDIYTSWSPKDTFEAAYMMVGDNNTITQENVDNFIKETHVSTIGNKTTMVRVVLVNGFEIIETSSCVDATNYNESLGTECCMDKIKDKIWFLLGFLLQTAVGGVK